MKRYPFSLFWIVGVAGFCAIDSMAFAEERDTLAGTWEFVTYFGDEKQTFTFNVPKDGELTFDGRPATEIEFEESLIAFTFTFGEKGDRVPLQFEGTLDGDAIVGEFLYAGSVVSQVDAKRISTRAEAPSPRRALESDAGDDLNLVGKTFLYEEDGEEVTFAFREKGEVFISGSEYGNGILARFEQDEEDLVITIGDDKVYASYDGDEFDLEEPEYFPEGYSITAVDADAYTAREFISSFGDRIQYWLFIPENYDDRKKYPLVLFNHGAGGLGNLDGVCLSEWAGPERQAANPCFILAPKFPGGKKKKSSGSDMIPEGVRGIQELIDEIERDFSIDMNREYVTGLSMGGTGTYMAIVARPDRFAAAVPVCGNEWILKLSPQQRGEEIRHLPIWIFHGEDDPVIPVNVSRDIVSMLKAAGGNPKYTEYPGVGHDSWSRAYRDSELIDWLFAQSK